MKRQIIKGPGYCAVMEDGLLMEYLATEQTDQCGDILLGRADRMMPGMKCAFINIGRKRSGFLPLDEESLSFTGKQIQSGDWMILQVKKEENGDKGAFLTRDITLPGRLVILMPMNRYTGVSSRIRDEEIREKLKKTAAEIAAGQYGLIMRNAAAGAETDEIRREAEELQQLWLQTTAKAGQGGKPGRVLLHGDPAEQIREDYAAGSFEDVPETAGTAQEIRRQLRQAAERKLSLPGGGNIVIDRCEAMTVIDVNTASDGTGGTKEQHVLNTNLEACGMIACQVRLRNLSGIILIDFINMDKETDQSLVEERLRQCFSYDRVKTVIHGWTRLGLMEMTRKRTRQAKDFSQGQSAGYFETEDAAWKEKT